MLIYFQRLPAEIGNRRVVIRRRVVAGRVWKKTHARLPPSAIAHDETRTSVASRPSGTFGLMGEAGAGQPFVFKERSASSCQPSAFGKKQILMPWRVNRFLLMADS
jgi:hypothetical protein